MKNEPHLRSGLANGEARPLNEVAMDIKESIEEEAQGTGVSESPQKVLKVARIVRVEKHRTDPGLPIRGLILSPDDGEDEQEGEDENEDEDESSENERRKRG